MLRQGGMLAWPSNRGVGTQGGWQGLVSLPELLL